MTLIWHQDSHLTSSQSLDISTPTWHHNPHITSGLLINIRTFTWHQDSHLTSKTITQHQNPEISSGLWVDIMIPIDIGFSLDIRTLTWHQDPHITSGGATGGFLRLFSMIRVTLKCSQVFTGSFIIRPQTAQGTKLAPWSLGPGVTWGRGYPRHITTSSTLKLLLILSNLPSIDKVEPQFPLEEKICTLHNEAIMPGSRDGGCVAEMAVGRSVVLGGKTN